MNLSNIYMVATNNFLTTISVDNDVIIRRTALVEMGNEINKYGEHIPDFIVFDPNSKTRNFEDEKRTLRIPMPSIPGKVYAKLDDYGSKETLSEQVGHKVNTQFVVTFMMAEDY